MQAPLDISVIAAIVAPPLSGKSYLMNSCRLPYTQDVDAICMPRSTARLDELRSFAKRTNQWMAYNNEWASEIKRRVAPGTRIILLPTVGLAEALGARIIHISYLERVLWETYVERKHERLEKHLVHYLTAVQYGGVESLTSTEFRRDVVTAVTQYNKLYELNVELLTQSVSFFS